MKVTFHARFGIGGGAGDCPTDHNSGGNVTPLPDYPSNPQSYNRYSYVQNSPLNRIDPTGHEDICDDPLQCNEPPPSPPPIPTGPMVTFDIVDDCTSSVEGACVWSQEEMDTIIASAIVTATKLRDTLNAANPGWNLTYEEAFLLVYGGSVSFKKMGGKNLNYWGETFLKDGRHVIEIYGKPEHFVGDVNWGVHELGHAFVNAVAANSTANPVTTLEQIQELLPYFPNRPLTPNDPTGTWGFAGRRWRWQRSDQGRASEEFADMFLGWAYNEWEPAVGGGWTSAGQMRANFMNSFMPLWVDMTVAQ